MSYIRIYSKWLLNRPRNNTSTAKKVIVFDLRVKRLEKYYFPLIIAFDNDDYSIVIRNRPDFIGSFLNTGSFIEQSKHITLSYRLPQGDDVIYFYDTDKPSIQASRQIRIRVDALGSEATRENAVIAPYPMSPLFYQGQYKEVIQRLRYSSQRKVKAFFSGNLHRSSYTRPIIGDYFKKVNRVELIETLCSHLSQTEVTKLESLAIFTQQRGEYLNRFAFLDWNWDPQSSSNLNLRVSNEDWLSFLSNVDFFLHCPGIVVPPCFNQTESMAMGAIPITESPEFFNPPLRHMENAIVFSGKVDLIIQMKLVLEMNEDEINRLRMNVIQYYDDFLSSKSICRLVEHTGQQQTDLFIITDYAIESITQ